MLKKEQIQAAIQFLFPELEEDSKSYEKIATFIRKEYKRLGTSVLYYLNTEFMSLIHSLGLSIGNKEVILTAKAVRATNNYAIAPRLIFSCWGRHKTKKGLEIF